jgi:hypothetical protein
MFGEGPKENSLGYCHELIGGQRFVTALPPGTYMYLLLPNGEPKVVPLILAHVRKSHLLFICGCGREGCTRRLVFKGRWEGWHKRDSNQAVAQENPTAELDEE